MRDGLPWSRTERRGDCLVWTGATSGAGYGQTRHNGRTEYTHRLAWELTYGPIPPRVFVCHRCDNPPCCEPTHLFLGTQKENMADASHKGRVALNGTSPGTAERLRRMVPQATALAAAKRRLLTDEQAVEIQQRARAGERQSDLARVYGVSPQVVNYIVQRKGVYGRLGG